jgi:hypothetical protein
MTTITFLSADLDEKEIKFDLKQKMKDVCKRYADEINQNIKHLVFYSNGKKLHKKMSVSEFIQTNQEKELYVVLMNENINSESEEEQAKSKKLKEEFLECFKQDKKVTYNQIKELTTMYGFDIKKRIDKEKKEHPENFIDIEEAIKNKDQNEKLYVIGQLGKSLKNLGIEVAIDKREGKNIEESIIMNQIISSGLLQETKYEIHFKENDINKKYAIISNEDGEQEKQIKKMKALISEKTGYPEKDIFIANIREGSVTADVSIKKYSKDIEKKMEELSKSDIIECIYEKNILEACQLTPDMLDERGDRKPSEWPSSPQKRGGIPYHPPTNKWVGYGLKVWDQYDNGNNDWIGMDGNENEWAVAFHGTGASAVNPICKKGGKFYSTKKEGATRQYCVNDDNINEKSKDAYPKCGEGTYVSPHLDYANYYANQNASSVIIMCRVNPNKIRIPKDYAENEWITDGTRETIRPYRILVGLK